MRRKKIDLRHYNKGRPRKKYRCIECGRVMKRRSRSGRCVPCAIKHMMEAARSMKEGYGEHFITWAYGTMKGIYNKNPELFKLIVGDLLGAAERSEAGE